MPKVKPQSSYKNSDEKNFSNVFEPLGMTFSVNGSPEAIADECPFCGRDKFYMNVQKGVYHCKHCDAGGNVSQLLTHLHGLKLKGTTDDQYRELKDKRGVNLHTLKRHELAFHPIQERWWIPFKDTKGNVVNLQLYSIRNGQKMNLPRLPTSIYNLNHLTKDKRKILFLCEGPFDCIALDCNLGAKGRQKYDILAVPGSGFKEQWCQFFEGRKVRVLFDNDEGGKRQAEQVRKLLGESRVARDVSVLKWPPSYPEGYDINDLVREDREISIPQFSKENCVTVKAKRRMKFRHGRSNNSPKEIDWIWPHHLRCGTYASFSGRQGTMKTTVAIEVAARYTTGAAMPKCDSVGMPPGHVLYIHAEDDANVVDGLFEQSAGNLQKWHTHTAVLEDGDPLNILDHLEEIGEVIREFGIRLVIVDGQNSVVGAPDISTDMKGRHNVTNKLHQFAQKLNVCVLGIRNEDTTGRPLGSASMTDISRCVWRAVEFDADSKKKKKRYFELQIVKVSDTAPTNYPPIPYSVEDRGGNRRKILWGKERPKKVALEESLKRHASDPTKHGNAKTIPKKVSHARCRA